MAPTRSSVAIIGDSSRRRAQSWPYERHESYEQRLRAAGSQMVRRPGIFCTVEVPVHSRRAGPMAGEHHRAGGRQLHHLSSPGLRSSRRAFSASQVHPSRPQQPGHAFQPCWPASRRRDLLPLRTAFSAAGIPWPGDDATITFEVEDRSVFNEDSGQPTSIDLAIAGNGSAPRLYIEAKLVEREFGGCSVFEQGDCDGMNPAADPPCATYITSDTSIGSVWRSTAAWMGRLHRILSASWPGTTSFSANSFLLSTREATLFSSMIAAILRSCGRAQRRRSVGYCLF